MNRNRYLVLMLVVLVILATACQPKTPPPVTPLPVQTPGTVLIESDSITWQYTLGGGETDFPNAEFHVGPGWTLDKCALFEGCVSPTVNIKQAVAEGRADTVVAALGTNEAYQGGWTREDEVSWLVGLIGAVPNASCIVIVKPYVDPVKQPSLSVEVGKARAWMDTLPNHRDNVVLVDWKPYYTAPVQDIDGIHISMDPSQPQPHRGVAPTSAAAMEARQSVISEGLAGCSS